MVDARTYFGTLQLKDLPYPSLNSFCPQITQIDADDSSKGPGLYLRYLRHLRENLGGWAAFLIPNS